MRSGRLLAIALATALLAALAALPAGASAAVETPPAKALTRDGALGRYLLDGHWLFRSDRHRRGDGARYSRGGGGGWRTVTVPNAWNANDLSARSMGGSNVWYRKDFRLPRAHASDWIVRFESVRYRANVWLNGRFIGSHEGAYLPWELHLVGLRRGVNHLAIQVNNTQHATDLPPGKVTTVGVPSGGWWNWGGILRDVYLRRVNGIDIAQAQVLPLLRCRTCSAAIAYRVTVRNYRRRAQRIRVTTTFGGRRATLGSVRVAAGSAKRVSGRVTIANPHLWSPNDPYLYPVKISASGGGSAAWSLHSGIRAITVKNGQLMLNFRPAHFRGAFLHEDDPKTGGAITHARTDLFMKLAKQLGSTVLRTHYPLNPYLHEQADRMGIMIWSEIPVFQIYTSSLAKPEVKAKALRMLRENILANGNHASVLNWSLGNELNPDPTEVERGYFNSGAKLAHRLDPTRPVALAIQGYPLAGCLSAYKRIQLLGLNAYFGWYPGPFGSIADRTKLGPYLDQQRACYRDKALAVTEFGAEANRSGPVEDRGTYEFQAKLNDYELGVFAQKPWLSGAIGMLIEFRVRPGWAGGNPLPSPTPIHQKGVFDFLGNPKPAAAVLSRWFHDTQQWDAPQG